MFKYIFPLYWVPGLRVRTSSSNFYAITPICFAIDWESGRIVSHAFSYGLARTDLLGLGMLALREKRARSGGSNYMFRSAAGDLSLAKRKLDTDYATLSLTDQRHCAKPTTYDWHRVDVLLGHFFYDWSNDFLSQLDNFRVVSPELLIRLIEHMVSRFNRLIESGDMTFKVLDAKRTP
jgi:hypothetical protein